jgi:hypothetical protein
MKLTPIYQNGEAFIMIVDVEKILVLGDIKALNNSVPENIVEEINQ